MTSKFKNVIIPWIFKWEGTKYENDPDDPGGETKFGIDKRSHKSVDIKNLTADQATDIYWAEWCRMGCEHMTPPMDWLFFNCAINCGVMPANQFLRESAGDANKYLDLQNKHYKGIADRRPASRKFLKGWIARTEDLRKCALRA